MKLLLRYQISCRYMLTNSPSGTGLSSLAASSFETSGTSIFRHVVGDLLFYSL